MVASNLAQARSAFTAIPDPGSCARPAAAETARAELLDCLQTGGGIALLTAPAGLGKTVLCRRLQGDLEESFRVLLFAGGGLATPAAFLQAALCELGRAYRERTETELRLEFQQALREAAAEGRPVVLIFDEAHTLPEDVLEEVRTATNVIEAATPAARVLLCGQFELEEKLTSRRLDALNQRIGCHVHLEPLTRQQSRAFIQQRLDTAGLNAAELFTDEALRTICIAADGNPRCLDRLCDRSVQLAGKTGTQPVDDGTVRSALEELRQLPLHWNEPPAVDGTIAEVDEPSIESDPEPQSGDTGVMEFGGETDVVESTEPVSGTVAVVEFGAEPEEPATPVEDAVNEEDPLDSTALEDCLSVEDEEPAGRLKAGHQLRAEDELEGWEPVAAKAPLKRETVENVPDVCFGEYPPEHDSPFSVIGTDETLTENRPLVLQREEDVDDHYALLLAAQERAVPNEGPTRPRAFEATAGCLAAAPAKKTKESVDPPTAIESEPDDLRPQPDTVIDSVIAAVDEATAELEEPVPSRRESAREREFVIPSAEFCFDEPEYDIVMPPSSFDEAASQARDEAPQSPPRPQGDLFTRLRKLQGGR